MNAMNRLAIALLTTVLLGAPSLARAEDFKGPESCADCHSDVYDSWKLSKHSKAYSNEAFQRAWKENKELPACLECHTTGHEKETLKYQHEGVSCESCHGAMSEGHPDKGMPVPVSSEMCQSCHKKTYQEWKISKHGIKNIRCFDCHNVHAQGLRAGGGDALCGSCHENRLTDFAHSTHHAEGLQCATCHMPMYKTDGALIEGTGAAGHTLAVGVEVCSRCHEDNVHKSGHLPELRERVTEINQQMAAAGVDNVFDLNEKVKDLQWHLARANQSAWVVAVLFFICGVSLGWLGRWYVNKQEKKRGNGPDH